MDPNDRSVAHRSKGGKLRRSLASFEKSHVRVGKNSEHTGRYKQGGGDIYADKTCPHCSLASDTALWQSGAIEFIHGVPSEPSVIAAVESRLRELERDLALGRPIRVRQTPQLPHNDRPETRCNDGYVFPGAGDGGLEPRFRRRVCKLGRVPSVCNAWLVLHCAGI